MNFTGRLVLGTSVVLVLAMSILVWVAERSLKRDLYQEIARSVERQAELIRDALPSDSLQWQDGARRLGIENGIRVTIIDRDGRVRAESDVEDLALANIENHRDRPEVQAALAGQIGSAERRSATLGETFHYVAVPWGPGVVRVASNLDGLHETIRRARRAMFLASLLALAVGVVLAYAAARSVARPLLGLTAAARAIAAGNTPRFPHSGIPDIDHLVQSLRQMSHQLTDRFEALRTERAGSNALVESMVEAVVAADERGRIVTANPAARHLLGYEEDAVLPDLRGLFRAKAARDVVEAVLGGEAVSQEVEMDERSVLINGRALNGGGAVLVMHDLTALRRLEVVRRDFVANVSHELKTPLTSISGYAETLIDTPPEPATAKRFLETIQNNALRMHRLVDDLLDLSRIESGHWQPEQEAVGLSAVAAEVWAPLAGRAAKRGVRFENQVPSDLSVYADPNAMRQILTNLFDNAVRHTSAGGVTTCHGSRAEEGTTVEVRDTGSGIGSEHLPRIFERFYRAGPSRSRAEGGTGLGLAIVKHLVEAHGGRVWVESELGRGTSVFCWFPHA